jgi:hypothetical protein
MKIGLIFISFILISKAGKCVDVSQPFDKANYYSIMASGNLADVNAGLVLLQQLPATEKDAYEGALLMRKAGLLRQPKEKLSFFRSGARKLETALAKDSSNAEYHFLRLIIQEHAPAVVHYNRNMKQDSQIVYDAYKRFSPVVQKAIMDYSKHSKFLREKELNG